MAMRSAMSVPFELAPWPGDARHAAHRGRVRLQFSAKNSEYTSRSSTTRRR